jgi:CubicO group peptidase (beta-lactamase class C family)
MSRPWTARRIAAYITAAVIVSVAVAVAIEWRDIGRVLFARSMFSGRDQVENFRSMHSMFAGHVVHRAAKPYLFAEGTRLSLPKTFLNAGKTEDTESFLAATDTTGLLILKDDKLVFEQYWRGNSAGTAWIAWSVSKSFTSALVGIAVHDGAIASIEDPITKYVPELKGSAYDAVRIKDALQMSSGARWNEDYSDSQSDVNRFGRAFALGGSLDAFAATLTREFPPGTFNRYNSMDAQVLGMILRRTTGKTETDYLQEKLWAPLGMESDAYWITDNEGVEFAAGGLNATLRDFAKLGRLYMNGGLWNGTQIVPSEWVHASVTPDAPHLMPGKRASSDSTWGYGYQWWVPDGSGAFSAVGIYNQFVYVNPALHLVIAKTSANHNYGRTNDESSYREDEHIAFFKAIERALSAGSG